MEKNKTLLAVILSVFIIMTYQMWMAKRYPQANVAPQERAQTVTPAVAEPLKGLSGETIAEQETEYGVETEKFLLTFSNIGGALKKVELKEFSDRETGQPYGLMSAKDPAYYIGAASIIEEGIGPGATYSAERSGNKMIFTRSTEGLEVEKVYTIHNTLDYIELYITIRNNTDRDIKATTRMITGSSIDISSMMSQRYHYVSAKADGVIGWYKKEATKAGDISWVTLNNEYFMILTRPSQIVRKAIVGTLNIEGSRQKNIYCGLECEALDISKGRDATQRFLIYIGPFETSRLATLGMGLEEAVNYGKLNTIVKALFSTLRLFQKVVRNWGVAIICLTVLVNAILFPLTRNSYKSLKVSQELQPQIEKLRAAHKDNPNKAQKEIMELYRKYKVNPLGGCLPMFLQFPIFFALYHVLIRSIELKGASFLWAKDLSMPDALSLPFTLPFLGNSINILPIAASAIMFIQQKVMSGSSAANASEQMRQQQAMMAVMIPGMMLVFFYKMPSGFVLYFLVNSALMAYVQHKIKTSLAP
ncbi:MAG: membrane protein insertase YidC [Candidatus Omnitrophota bacterium]